MSSKNNTKLRTGAAKSQHDDHPNQRNKTSTFQAKKNGAFCSSSSLSSPVPPALWWKKLPEEEECPITLEPLCTLDYPPFQLVCGSSSKSHQSISNSSATGYYYFDGLALASYIVSRGMFQNPLTREDLSMEDCRLLDKYVERYSGTSDYSTSWHNNDNTSTSSRRKVYVAEAFAIHQSLQVSTKTGTTAGRNGAVGGAQSRQQRDQEEERNRCRADVLRREATAALAGLFVFSDKNNSHSSQQYQNNRKTNQAQSFTKSNSTNTLPLASQYGFNLYQQSPNQTAIQEMDGLRIIDDDEVIADASDQQAYEAIQKSFPPLVAQPSSSVMGTLPTAAASAAAVKPNEELLSNIRHTAQELQYQEELKKYYKEQGKQQLLLQALERRQERVRERKRQQMIQEKKIKKDQEHQREQKYIQQEIELWRQEQFEKLVRLQQEQQRRKQREEVTKSSNNNTEECNTIDTENTIGTEARGTHCLGGKEVSGYLNEDDENKAKQQEKVAKAAAKRKRAKERKKLKKQQEQEELLKKEQKKKELQQRKENSKTKCACCKKGILDCGFEKNGNTFCSPKCARAGVSS